MTNTKELVSVINLKALNTFNAEQVEEGLLPIPLNYALDRVEELVNGYAEDLAEQAREQAYQCIERFVSYNWRSYEGNDLEYADTTALVNAIANKAKSELF